MRSWHKIGRSPVAQCIESKKKQKNAVTAEVGIETTDREVIRKVIRNTIIPQLTQWEVFNESEEKVSQGRSMMIYTNVLTETEIRKTVLIAERWLQKQIERIAQQQQQQEPAKVQWQSCSKLNELCKTKQAGQSLLTSAALEETSTRECGFMFVTQTPE